MPKNGLIIFCWIMLAMASGPVCAGVKNPDTFVLANYGTLRTLDPAVCYDAAGSQRIWNLKAFLHAFDRRTYKEDVFNNLVILPTSPNIEGLPYHKDVPVYEYDLIKSKEYCKKTGMVRSGKKVLKWSSRTIPATKCGKPPP
jgi:hypothetical protein